VLPVIPDLFSAFCLVLFTAMAGVDGLYFHLYRYRLYRRPECRYEHRLHTVNAVLFVPLVAMLFCVEPRGLYLWLWLLLFLASLGVEVLDVLCERASRQELGGLLPSEYLMHFLMSGLRFGFCLPLVVIAPAAAFRLQSTGFFPRPLYLLLCGVYIAVPAVGIAALHVVLDARGRAALARSRH
jgi:hypothetical protein